MRLLMLIVLTCFCALQIVAQTMSRTVTQNLPPSTAQTKGIDLEKIVVTDSSGQVYPTDIVKRLLATGKFGIRWVVPNESGMMFSLTEAQILEKEKRMPKPMESKFFRTGFKITNFNERDMEGNKFNIKELVASGKIVVLNFWFVNCPPCRREIPGLNDLVNQYKTNQDIVFIAIALDEKYSITDFLKSNPFEYHIIDNGRYIASQYGITSYPTHVVLNKKGNVLFHTTGFGSNTIVWVKKSIEAALHDTLPE